jgi:hypothetical protein
MRVISAILVNGIALPVALDVPGSHPAYYTVSLWKDLSLLGFWFVLVAEMCPEDIATQGDRFAIFLHYEWRRRWLGLCFHRLGWFSWLGRFFFRRC